MKGRWHITTKLWIIYWNTSVQHLHYIQKALVIVYIYIYIFFFYVRGSLAEGKERGEKQFQWDVNPIKDVKKNHRELEDKCLETSLLKELKSQGGGNIEAGREFQSLLEKGISENNG